MGKQSITTLSRIVTRLVLALPIFLSCAAAWAQSANTPLLLPAGLAYDEASNLYFAETGDHIVRRLSVAGVLSVVAGTGVQGFGGDSGLATAALLDSPMAIAVNGSGDLFVADTHNHRIRRVDAVSGMITTYANARSPVALTFDPQGGLVYADAALHKVLLVNAATGLVSVLAGDGVQGFSGDGGFAPAASLDTPSGLAFDSTGNLFIADAHNHCVRRVDAKTDIISTVVGTGQPGFSGDQLAATRSRLDLPRGLAVDTSGDLFIADSRNQRIRRVDAATGLITTIAGDGTQAFLGDGSQAIGASLDSPNAITISPAFIPTLSDSRNNRVRQVDSAANIQTIVGVGAISPTRAVSTTLLAQSSSTTLTATVSAAVGPTGSATLVDGATPVSAVALVGGRASFAMSGLSTGSHTLTAAYSGNSALLPSGSLPLIVTIGSPTPVDFSIASSGSSTMSVVAGSAATFNFSVTLTGAALTSPIELSVAGAPSGATSSFSPAVIAPPSGPASFTLTIDTPTSARLQKPGELGPAVALVLSALLLPAIFRRRGRGMWLLGLLVLTGCGARINSGNSTAKQPVTYNVIVSATATGPAGASLLHTAQVTLIVQ